MSKQPVSVEITVDHVEVNVHHYGHVIREEPPADLPEHVKAVLEFKDKKMREGKAHVEDLLSHLSNTPRSALSPETVKQYLKEVQTYLEAGLNGR